VPKVNILHIASFNGNIGDNAHHNGFRDNFNQMTAENIKWDNLEIREFYKSWNVRKFDDNFVRLANEYDLLVIGGGNFFEICHEYSNTGCTIDITIETLKKIKTPIFFNALGFDINKGYTDKTKKDYEKFIKYISESEKYFVTFRNDGSKNNFEKVYGELNTNIHIIPDGGFFLKVNDNYSEVNRKFVGINLACDMFNKRIKTNTYDEFCEKIAGVFEFFFERNENYSIMFFPHIFTDLKIIYDVVSKLDDKYIKYHVKILPYTTSQGNENEFFKYYKACDLISGFRFHTNVCAIALNIPTLGLVTYPKVGELYKEIGLDDRAINVNDEKFFDTYLNKIEESLNKKDEIQKRYTEVNCKLRNQRDEIYVKLKKWLKEMELA